MPEPMQYEEIEAIARKGEADEKRKGLQFGVRKLLWWTALAAVWLGLLRMVGVAPLVIACIAGWVAVNAGLRWAFGSPVLCVFSVVAGAIAGGGLVFADSLFGARFSSRLGPPFLPVAALFGGYAGFLSYVLLEVAFCMIGLPDGLLRSKSYDRQGPP
jgi:hypothetical protein